MGSFQKFLDQLIQEGKININESSVVVEFFCGFNPTAAKVISKYRPKIYYANDSDWVVFNPRASQHGTSFPTEIDGMKVKPLICNALDVDYKVPNYEIGLFHRSFQVIMSAPQNSPSPNDTRTYWSWLEKVKEELEQNKFETLERYFLIEENKKHLSRWLKYVKNNREDNIELLKKEVALRKYCGSPFGRFFNSVYVLIEKVHNSLSKNGALLIFEKDEYWSDKAKKTLEKMQEHGYIKFREMDLLSPSSEEGLLYALK